MNKKSNIPAPFNPEDFRREGHLVVDTLSDYLGDALSGKDMPVLPWNEPDELTLSFSFDSGEGEKEPLNDFIKRIIANCLVLK